MAECWLGVVDWDKNYELGLREIPVNIFIKVLKEWKNYPARIKLLQVLKWYQNEINSTKK